MNIAVELLRTEFQEASNWFIQVELQQTAYPSKEITKTKLRTDISVVNPPVFDKRYFLFENISLSNRIIMKFGAIDVSRLEMDKHNYLTTDQINPSHCTIKGVYNLVFTQKIISSLRDGVPVSMSFKFVHPTLEEEIGICSISLGFQVFGIDEKIIEDERIMRKIGFDRYEEDNEAVAEKLRAVSEMCDSKNGELNTWIDLVDKRRNALRSLGVDIAMMKKQKDELNEDNEKLRSTLSRKQSVDEIHIQYDMLSNSEQGIELLKQKTEQLRMRHAHEQNIYKQHQQNWLNIERKQAKAEEIQDGIELVKKAMEENKFHYRRYSEQLPQIAILREQIKSHDIVVQQLETRIKEAITNEKPTRELVIEIEDIKFEKAKLGERYKQVQTLLDMNNGVLPIEVMDQLRSEVQGEDSAEKMEALMTKASELMNEIETLGNQLAFQKEFTLQEPGNEDSWQIDKMELELKLEAANTRVDAMQKQMDEQALKQAREISTLRAQIAELEAMTYI